MRISDWSSDVCSSDLHGRRSGDEVQIIFARQPLLNDFKMQQAQKTTAEAKAQRRARFHLKAEAGVVKPQLGNGVAQLFEVVRIHGEQSAEHTRLHLLDAGQRRWREIGRESWRARGCQ